MKARAFTHAAWTAGLILSTALPGPRLPSQSNVHYSGGYLDPRLGTMALWHLDETQGTTLKDVGPFRLDGRMVPGASRIRAPWGMALKSAPKTGAFQVQDSRNLLRLSYPFTLEAWVRVDKFNLPVHPILSRKGSSCNAVFELRFMSFPSGFAFKVLDSQGVPQVLYGRVQARPGEWHHVAVTWDGKESRLYGDGRLLSTLPLSPFQTPDLKQPLLVGAGENGAYLAGAVDEVHIAAGVLPPSSFRSGWANYGIGKKGGAGLAPTLSLQGGPPSTACASLRFVVDKGTPYMPGLFFLSSRPDRIFFGGGLLLVSPAGMVTTPIQLDQGIGGIPGTARTVIHLPPPGPTFLGRPLFFQALLVDLQAPGFFSMTPGAAVWFPY